MAIAVIMPRQGQSVETCIIGEWLKKKGDSVKKGDILFTYETDKASFEKEAEEDGVLLDIFFNAGDEVPVLENVAVIGKAGESVDAFRPGGAKSETASAPVKEEVKVEKTEKALEVSVPLVIESSGDFKASPRAKKTADKIGVPVQQLQGSGPQGRIIERDVLAYVEQGGRLTPAAKEMMNDSKMAAPAIGSGVGGRVRTEDLFKAPANASGADYEVKKISNIRKIIAQNMLNSMQTTAQLTHHISADARNMLALREKIKPLAEKKEMPNITINDMVCFAVVKTLKRFPDVNCHFLGDSVRTFSKVHLGIAVDTPRGLMVPTLKNADDFNLQGLAVNLKDIAMQCKEGKINPELLASEAGSFTISNLGAYGIEMFTPVINIPQVAILGVCTISPKPKDLGNGTVAFVPHIGLSLTYDHRALDGAPASAFMKELKNEIEQIQL
jgi:pyruvate dehydrogenase E2 component (dihydrolipoamide acetyltransferase)